VRKSSRHLWGELLRAGVRIYEYQPSMYHPKLLIVDDVWTSVGSTNFDERSLKLNDEASLNVHDRTFAATQGDVFERDLQRSIEITFEEWQGRSLTEKLTDWLTSTLRSQL
jgi:cardiolipin synthase